MIISLLKGVANWELQVNIWPAKMSYIHLNSLMLQAFEFMTSFENLSLSELLVLSFFFFHFSFVPLFPCSFPFFPFSFLSFSLCLQTCVCHVISSNSETGFRFINPFIFGSAQPNLGKFIHTETPNIAFHTDQGDSSLSVLY